MVKCYVWLRRIVENLVTLHFLAITPRRWMNGLRTAILCSITSFLSGCYDMLWSTCEFSSPFELFSFSLRKERIRLLKVLANGLFFFLISYCRNVKKVKEMLWFVRALMERNGFTIIQRLGMIPFSGVEVVIIARGSVRFRVDFTVAKLRHSTPSWKYLEAMAPECSYLRF